MLRLAQSPDPIVCPDCGNDQLWMYGDDYHYLACDCGWSEQ